MNNKIPLKRFAEQLAAKTGCTVDDAQSFVKELFQIVADGVYNGESVDIKGLGVFSASPNVVEPVKFVPADEFADDLNSPFGIFQPVVIGDNVSVDELDSISVPEDDVQQSFSNESDRIDSVSDDNISEDTEVKGPENTTEETVVESEVVEVEPDSAVETDETSDMTSDVIESDNRDQEKESVEEASSDTVSGEEMSEESGQDVVDDDSAHVHSESDISECCQEDAPTEMAEKSEMTDCQNSDNKIVSEVATPDVTAEEDDDTSEHCTYLPEEDEEFVEYYDAPKSKFGIGFLVGLLTGLLIGALAIAAYAIYFVNNGTTLF